YSTSFITEVENLVDKKVKIIRCENGTEFKNRVLSEFCKKKGIKKEFSVARTSQQNGVAKRRNRILIEAARTMLSESKLLTTFWTEAVNTSYCKDGSLFDSSSKNSSNDEPQPSSNAGKKDDEGVCKESGIDDQERHENSTQRSINIEPDMFSLGDNAILEATHADFFGDEIEVDMRNITTTYPVPSIPNTRIYKYHSLDHVIGDVQSGKVWTLVDLPYGKRVIGTKWVYKNKKDKRGIVVRNKARLMDVKSAFLYGKIEEEVYVCQPSGFEDPEFLDRVYKVMQKEDGIFISQDKYVDEIFKKFGFSTVRIASTPMETSKPLLKDAEAKDVDVHLYKSMIRSLMYLTAYRPDIMFDVCACARFQVTPKVSHLHAVKGILRKQST
ncbi:putative ribonuclease H-like domain-containing protein, partial [Tanacetum coccineum]